MMSAVSRMPQPVSLQESQPLVRFGYDTHDIDNNNGKPFKIELGLNSATLGWLKKAFSGVGSLIQEAFTLLANALEKIAQALTPVNPPTKEM